MQLSSRQVIIKTTSFLKVLFPSKYFGGLKKDFEVQHFRKEMNL